MTHLTPDQIDAILTHQETPDEPPAEWLAPDHQLAPIPLNTELDGWEQIYATLM